MGAAPIDQNCDDLRKFGRKTMSGSIALRLYCAAEN
jgi:hypothetical protein